jgi:hypothetical protein
MTNLNRSVLINADLVNGVLIWGIITVKIYQRLNSRQNMNRLVNQLVNATIWLIIDKLYDARQFYRPLLDNFYNIPVLQGNEESALMNRYLLSLQRLQSALFEQHSEYYLEELLKTMLAFTPEVHSLMSWKLGQTWLRLNLQRHFERCHGNPLIFFTELNELTEDLAQYEIVDICGDYSLNNN